MFKCQQFHIHQKYAAMKVCSDSLLFASLAQAQGLKVADFGAGTGVLSLICAQKDALSVDAVEMDILALKDLELNLSESPWSQKCSIYAGRIQDLPKAQPYELIISNPPFFVESLKSHNPQRARARHNDDMSYAELLNAVVLHLDSHGVFQVLLPTAQCESFVAMAQDYGLYLQRMVNFKATPSKPSHVSAMFMMKSITQTFIEEICIWTEHKDYSPESRRLLGDLLLRFQN